MVMWYDSLESLILRVVFGTLTSPLFANDWLSIFSAWWRQNSRPTKATRSVLQTLPLCQCNAFVAVHLRATVRKYRPLTSVEKWISLIFRLKKATKDRRNFLFPPERFNFEKTEKNEFDPRSPRRSRKVPQASVKRFKGSWHRILIEWVPFFHRNYMTYLGCCS